MKVVFYKYQATGNDFVIIDNRLQHFDKENVKLVAKLCDRKFGVGADGLILLENDADSDFKMIYFNADGNLGSMCGNGSRCIIAFANHLGIIENKCSFQAYDGLHSGEILEELTENDFQVKVSMQNVNDIEVAQHVFLDTGSPHFVCFVDDVDEVDVIESGRAVRYNEKFKSEGTNVDFVTVSNNQLSIRTYERGVEDETLSCGTGVTASVIAAASKNLITTSGLVSVKSKGGDLKVYFEKEGDAFNNIFLEGAVQKVFSGTFNLANNKVDSSYA
ncbi:MAG: diaminopimelate epimerase [Bacteroidia bacterium]|nr:diaminopimelate epimerase [Bacteroidia bacterium]NNC85420.1 diaminopimelate epimerase [Bacteroidia bacterium]NNM16124.1 diaminopimelate epimerase [Bacteroidia bacterium]